MKNKKLTTTLVAVTAAAALLLSGTFAWQSINQTALNEASDIVNPGGRLHDDFDGSNKDVYVENFAEEPIFARIQLSEFFEVVLNAGTAGEKTVPVLGEKTQQIGSDGNGVVDDEGNPVYDYNYIPYIFDDKMNEDGTYQAAIDATDGSSYWNWTVGGETVFMPTFNVNKDSLKADINGEYVDAVGGISERDGSQYVNYVTYEVDESKTANAIYDIDSNQADEIAAEDLAGLIDGSTALSEEYKKAVKLLEETHTAKYTGTAQLISMSEWLNMIPYNDETGEYEYNPDHYNDGGHAGYWVYDTDGWVYWSAPIPAGEATGLLLDGIELNQVMDDSWYYAINVVAQFCTAGDMGTAPVYSETEVDEDGNPILVTPGTGFFDLENGTEPTGDALTLLELIGVNDSAVSGDESVDPEDPAQVYTMHVYISGDDWQGYLVPGVTYNLEVDADANEYDDTAVALSIIDENGDALISGVDYEFGNNNVAFEDYTGNYGDSYAYSATTTLKILDEELVGTNITIVAEADQTGNTGTAEVSVNYERLDVIIELYDEDGDLVAGTGNGATITPNSTYDIVGTITGLNDIEYVIYSTLDSKPVSANVEVSARDVVAHAGEYHMDNYINEDGQLVVGAGETFDCNEVGDDGITNLDALTLSVGADVVRVYESADAITNGAEPTEIYYTYGQWDIFPTGSELYYIAADSVVNASPQNRTMSLMVGDGNDHIITDKDGLFVTVSDNTDTTGTKIELIQATDEQRAYYLLTIGEAETATELTVTASDSNGSGSKTIQINYLNTLKIGNSTADHWNDIYINSSNIATTAEISLVDYWGSAVEGVTYAIRGGNTSEGTYVEGSTLYIGAEEQAWPMYLSVTVNGETTEYQVYVNYTPDTTAPTMSIEYNGNPGRVNVTVNGVGDGDFPLTLKAYAQKDEAGTIAEAPYSTITINLEEAVLQTENTYISDMSYSAENGTLTLTYYAVPDGLTYYKQFGNGMSTYYGMRLTVADATGNESVSDAFNWSEGGCFVAGTQVQTVNGLVNIEDIKLGDEVYSIDLTTGAKMVNPVTWVQGTRYTDATYTIYAGGEEIVTTYEHPFYVFGKEWVAAEDLMVGDELMDMNGEKVVITDVVYTELDAPVQVYNFTVTGTHNYLITESGILVHNIEK